MLQSKIFANGSTALSKTVCDALGVNAGDRVRYVMSDKGVHVLGVPSDENSVQTHADDPALREALAAAEKVMDENRSLLRKLKLRMNTEM